MIQWHIPRQQQNTEGRDVVHMVSVIPLYPILSFLWEWEHTQKGKKSGNEQQRS
jgi:hypothetical protein